MRHMLGGTAVVALLAAAPGTVRAQSAPQTTRAATVDDLLAFQSVSDPTISPNGRWIAYVVTRGDREKNVNNATIWIVPAEGGAPTQLTRGPRADRAPQWAPDGSWLAFLSDRGENRR